jgi:hypothetical protein
MNEEHNLVATSEMRSESATVSVLLSFFVAVILYHFTCGYFSSIADDDYIYKPYGNYIVPASRIWSDVTKCCSILGALTGAILTLVMLILSSCDAQVKTKGYRFWILLFLVCWILANLGAITGAGVYLREVLPQLPKILNL